MEAPRTNLRRTGRLWVVPAILATVAAVGGGAWYLLRPVPPAEAPAVPAAAAATPAPVPADAAAEPPARAEEAPGLLERVSGSELLRKVLALGDVVHRWVVVTANLAAGESPRRELAVLAPRAPFTAERRGAGLAISAAACARYDGFADAVASIDAAAAAAAFRRLRGALDAAHRALGLSGASFDALTVRALRRVADAPAPPEPAAVVEAEGRYVFEDQRLEALPDVEKHLLRMGPRNERLIQAKARELLERLASATATPTPMPMPMPMPASAR